MGIFPVLNSNIDTDSGTFHLQTEVLKMEGSFRIDASIYFGGVVVFHNSLDFSPDKDFFVVSGIVHEKLKKTVLKEHEMLKKNLS